MTDAPFSADELAAGERLFADNWKFVAGVVDLAGLPDDGRPECAFAGRSNVGKSSLINALTRQKGLARTSNTPGRTQELNFFSPSRDTSYLVDLPGYGFAKAPKAKVETWTGLVRAYLAGRPKLRRVFLLVDARHGLKPPDREIMELLDRAAVTYQVVLTKSDKVSVPALQTTRDRTAEELNCHGAAFPVVLSTSAEKGAGLEELRAVVAVVLSR
jgi:GTP-binding protein